MSEDLSSRSVLVVDDGQFLELAIRLSREFGKVYFWNPSLIEGFPTVSKNAIGNGFSEFQWVRELFPVKNKVDLFIFPDCQNSGLQIELESQGKRVIGSRTGDTLENKRIAFKKIQKTIGLQVPKHVIVTGLRALADHLKSSEDVWVKFDRYRGTFETQHHINFELSKNWLDSLACALGPCSDFIEFLIEQPIRGKVEIGYDGFFFGEFPSKTLFGIERKSKSYIGAVKPYEEMDVRLREVNDALAIELKKTGYRNFFSTEVRIADGDDNFKDGTPVLIEPTCRIPSPPFEAELEIYNNIGAMLWHGSELETIEPVMADDFAVICRISHDDDPDGWRTIQVVEKARQWVKLYDAFKTDSAFHIAPKQPSAKRIGAIVGIGDSIEKAMLHCHKNVVLMEDQPISDEFDTLTDALRALQSAEDQNISVSDEPIPEPETALIPD